MFCILFKKPTNKKQKAPSSSPGRQAPSGGANYTQPVRAYGIPKPCQKKATTALSRVGPGKTLSNPASAGAERLQGILRAQFSVVTLSLLRYLTATSQGSLNLLTQRSGANSSTFLFSEKNH